MPFIKSATDFAGSDFGDVGETFSVKLGHLLFFLSLVFPFIRLQNNSPIYHLTSCLLFIEVDKGVNTSLRFVRYI